MQCYMVHRCWQLHLSTAFYKHASNTLKQLQTLLENLQVLSIIKFRLIYWIYHTYMCYLTMIHDVVSADGTVVHDNIYFKTYKLCDTRQVYILQLSYLKS